MVKCTMMLRPLLRRRFLSQTAADSYFEVLRIPRTFQIDETVLKHNYRRLMAEHHPDVQQSGTDDHATLVTRAYDTLKRPHTRATYLMELVGRPVDETASGALVGPAFLMEIMELREKIDATSENAKLRALFEANLQQMEQTGQVLAQALNEGDLDGASEAAAQLQYWNRIDETLWDKMEHE